MSSAQVLVFYSPKCRFCQNLLAMIEEIDVPAKLINIHEVKDRPKFLTQVPTIVASDSTVIFAGKLAFQFVNNQKQFRKSTYNTEAAKSIQYNTQSELLKYNKNTPINPYSDGEQGTNLSHPSLLSFEDKKK